MSEMMSYPMTYATHNKTHREWETTVQLLPCPFCGSRELEMFNTHTPSFSVECLGCGGSACGAHPQSFTLAYRAWEKAWNTRKP
jgi:hypothetical protein